MITEKHSAYRTHFFGRGRLILRSVATVGKNMHYGNNNNIPAAAAI
jgi:hypothetical protein